MNLASLRIENFRAFEDETINFNEYTCLVGPNGGGKSTALTALNILFRYPTDSVPNLLALDLEDFHHKNAERPIQLTATFVYLSPQAQEDFRNYYRQGKLIITAQAKWNGSSAPLKQYGQRMGIVKFGPFFAAEGDNAKVDELKKLYSEIQASFTELPSPGTKVAMVTALREYGAAHPELHQPILSEDEFYGVSKGKNLLEKYIEWAFVPAVKDVSAEEVERKTTALGQLLERTVRTRLPFSEPIAKLRIEVTDKYNDILKSQQSALVDLSTSLQTRLRNWAHPNTKLRLE